MVRKALGRGLSSLIREVEVATSGLEQIPVSAIEPNPLQPRHTFADEGLKELADSIRATGMVQPVLVRRAGGETNHYQLVAGERRWRAAKLAGLELVPALIRDLGDREALELALTENLLREDLNPLEVARAYEQLQQRFQLTHEEIAERLGLTRVTVSNTLRLLRLPEDVQKMVESNQLTAGHARALLSLDTPQDILKLARQIVREGLSVRQVEERVAIQAPMVRRREEKAAPKIDPNIRAAILELERVLGTRVKIVGKPERGRIEIQYFSGEDLNRIFEWITKRA